MKKKLATARERPPGFDKAINFCLGKRHRGYLGLVELAAGAYPIVGRPKSRGIVALRGTMGAVIACYRAALHGLVAAGRLTADQAHDFGNCRPAGFHAVPRPRMCNMAYLCPHCWARRAGDFWARIDAALFPPADGKRARHAAVDLIWSTRRIGPSDVQTYDDTLRGVLAERLADRWDGGPQLFGSRSLEMRRLRRGFLWAVEGLVIDVAYRGGRARGWKVAVRQLFAVPAGAAFEIPGAKVRRIATPSRREVAAAVVRLCRYPRGLLLDGMGRPAPAAAVDYYQESVAGRRLWAIYGDLPAAGLVRGE